MSIGMITRLRQSHQKRLSRRVFAKRSLLDDISFFVMLEASFRSIGMNTRLCQSH